jgi:protein phosphatase 1L
MAAVTLPIHDLSDWLRDSATATIPYHVGGRVALMGASLLSLAEAVSRAALSCVALAGYLASLGIWQSAKDFSYSQMQKGLDAGSLSIACFLSILSPEKLANRLSALKSSDPQQREHRIIRNERAIARKLENQFDRAQQQAIQALQMPQPRFEYSAQTFSLLPPISTETNQEGDGILPFAVSHSIGRRGEMEDAHLAACFKLEGQDNPVQLFGVFDGHGGKEAAEYVRDHLTDTLQSTLYKFLREFQTDKFTNTVVWNALKMTFVTLNEQFKTEYPLSAKGTTATVAMILNGQLWTANVGDSRTILDNGIQLSEDAKPKCGYYAKGIKNRGGVIHDSRIWGYERGLAVARAIGDQDIPGISARPKITLLSEIPKNSRLILACDGIYDVASTQQIVEAVHQDSHPPLSELAENIVYSAYQAGSKDNLSAMIVQL